MSTQNVRPGETAEHRLLRLLEMAPDAMLVVDRGGRVVLANTLTERLFGYQAREILGCPIENLIPERFREEHRGYRANYSAQPRTRPMGAKLELFGLRKDGTEFPVEISLRPIETAEGILVAGAIRDITERKRAEEALLESEEQFRLVANTAPVMIWMSGTDKLCTYVNTPWLDFTGRSMDAELGNGWTESIHPEDLQQCFDTYSQSFDRQDKFKMEYRLRRHDGEYRWILDNGVPRYAQEGTFAGYIGSCIDVTDSKRAEEARLRHAAIVESSEDAIISKNLDEIIVSWNAGAERIFGYIESEAIGQPITILIPPELQDEENTILERLRAGGRIEHYETTRVTKAGRKVDVSLIISPIKDSTGKLVGFCKLAHEITERKRAEQVLNQTNCALEIQTGVLRSQEELLKIFVKNVPVGVAMFDREMRYLQVSDRWCSDCGLDASQVVGRLHYELVPDLPERWKQAHRRTLEGHTLRAEEDRWDRQDGVATWIRWETRPWKTPSGTVGGILIFAENITHRKQMEEALSGVTGMLIEAEEKERARIARELHDDINQRLAMLTFGLDQLKVNPSEFESRVQELRKQTIELSMDVEALSHDLHSSKLEYLGVVAGMRSWCAEFGERQLMQIDFRHEVQTSIPSDIGLCLFRVQQEALHNVVPKNEGPGAPST